MPKLRTLRERVRVYSEMLADPTVGAVIFAFEQFARGVEWQTEPGEQTPRGRDLAKFLEANMHGMSHTWPDFLAEALSMVPYGFACHEIVYERRSDGRVYWRKLPIRSQDSISRWEFDAEGGIKGVWQYIIGEESRTKGFEVFIPAEKLLLFRPSSNKNNPEGRALALDTPILTLDGWKTMETVRVGDRVFDDEGKTRYVVAKSEVWHNRECYAVRFNTNEVIVADAEHLWLVTTAQDRTMGYPPHLLTTRQMYELFSRRRNVVLSVGSPTPLDYPARWLPLDPYLLGYWLGDGDTCGADITVSRNDWPSLKQNIERAGFEIGAVRPYGSGNRMRVYVKDLRPVLRMVGVLNNKHIPEPYLRGSFEQRLALLQGLMDSDGSSPGGRRTSHISNTNARLIEDIRELIRGLGSIPWMTCEHSAGTTGKAICGVPIKRTKDIYRLNFWSAHPVHRLERKLANQTRDWVSYHARGFHVRDITPVEPRDTVCIEVDSPSHLYLCGRSLIPTHNSALRSAVKPYAMKKRLETIEAIGIERDLAGMPVIKLPDELWAENPLAEAQREYAKRVVTSVRKDDMMGAVIPTSWQLDLLSATGSRALDTDKIIGRYDARIAQSVLADVILMGHSQVGSYALSEVKSDIFARAIKAWLDEIAEVLNRYAVPRLLALNGIQVESPPRFVHGPVTFIDVKTLADTIFRLVGVDALRPDSSLRRYLRTALGLPAENPEEQQAIEQRLMSAQARESLGRMLTGRPDNETRLSAL